MYGNLKHENRPNGLFLRIKLRFQESLILNIPANITSYHMMTATQNTHKRELK